MQRSPSRSIARVMHVAKGTKVDCNVASLGRMLHFWQVVSEDVGLSLDKIDMSKLGTAKKVSISKDDTIILDGGGEKDKINERCDQIRESVAASTSDYDKCGHSHTTVLETVLHGFTKNCASITAACATSLRTCTMDCRKLASAGYEALKTQGLAAWDSPFYNNAWSRE